jgi:DNA-nicking Smr family endonuclease
VSAPVFCAVADDDTGATDLAGMLSEEGLRTVLVITGKGHVGDGAGERGVLKRQVPLWLRLPEFRALVSAFEQAHGGHGGEGALYLRLRRLRTGVVTMRVT